MVEPRVWMHVPEGHVVIEAGKPAEHWALQLIAEYATLQSTIEAVVNQKLSSEGREMAKVITKRFLDRLTDTDRWSLVKALVKDSGYDGDMSGPSNIFWQAKRVRDLFAHHPNLPLVRDARSPDYYYQVAGKEAEGIPTPLTAAVLRQIGANCRWLVTFTYHLGSLSGANYASMAVSKREDGSMYLPAIECLAPPPLPIPADWEAGIDQYREIGESAITLGGSQPSTTDDEAAGPPAAPSA